MANLKKITRRQRTSKRGRKPSIRNGQRIFAYISEDQLRFLNKFGKATECESLSEALRSLIDDYMAEFGDQV